MNEAATVAVSEAEIVRSLCHASFYEFVKEFWSVVCAEEPVWNWHIEYLCDEFQKDAERVFRGLPKKHDTIVNIPPGTTKSTVLSIMAPAWLHARRPDMRVIAASHTQQLTFELGRKCRLVEESELYQKAFPEVVPSRDQWTKSLFMNTKGGGRLAATVGGMTPTGFHAHFLLVDDPLDPQQASRVSEAELDVANNFMDEVLPSRKVDKEVAVTWLIQQRLHQNDPAGHLLDKAKEKIRHICLPAELSDEVKPKELREQYVGGLLDPVRLNKSILEEAKIDLGPFAYAGQYDQNPIPRGGGDFHTERIRIEPAPPKHFVARVRYWDKAGTKGGGAFTAGVLMGKDRKGQFWVLHVKKGQWGTFEREEHIQQTAALDGEAVEVGVEQEPGSGGKESAQNTVRRLAGYRVFMDPPETNKIARARPFADQVGGENVCMVKGDWNHDYLEELRYWPHSTYKDQVDASSGAFKRLAKQKKIVGVPGRGMLKKGT